MVDPNELSNRFEYHPPNTHQKKVSHEAVRDLCGNLASSLNSMLPDCRETSKALTKIEEAMFWANAAIARKL